MCENKGGYEDGTEIDVRCFEQRISAMGAALRPWPLIIIQREASQVDSNNNTSAAIELLDQERMALERRLSDIRKALRTLRQAAKDAPHQDSGQATTSDAALEVVEKSPVPLTAREVADEIDGVSEGAVAASMTRLKRKGLIVPVPDSSPKRWVVPSALQPSGERVPNVELVS